MATLVENAIRIKQTFDDIHDAIIGKGITPSGGVDTYAEAISEIPAQVTVTPENCPFKLVFSSFAQGTTTASFTTTSTEVIDEDYFTMSDATHWQCEKSGRYLAFVSIGAHSSSGGTSATRYYTNGSTGAYISTTSAGYNCTYAMQNLLAGDTSEGSIWTSVQQTISGRIQIYYLGAV